MQRFEGYLQRGVGIRGFNYSRHHSLTNREKYSVIAGGVFAHLMLYYSKLIGAPLK